MTTKQSARPHLESINQDCFVVVPTLHQHPALLAMTRFGLFQESSKFSHIKCCLKVFTFETDSARIEDDRQIPASVTGELRLGCKTSPSPRSNSEVRVELGTDNDVQYFHTNLASSE